MRIAFVTDPLMTTAGATRPPYLVATELQKSGHEVTLVSLTISDEVQDAAKENNIQTAVLDSNFGTRFSLPIVESWAKALLKSETKLPDSLRGNDVLVNTSSCIKVKSHVYYGQGPMTRALDDMHGEMPARYKYSYRLSARLLRYLEKKSVKTHAKLSDLVVANSKFCASMYEDLGVQVDEIIPPPLDCILFVPTTSAPSQDYVLTYFGLYNKETKFPVIKQVADSGITVKAFGHKAEGIPSYIVNHPNVHFLGSVSDEELAQLYSNALFVVFTFVHEPFGYIPIESMACGTPVLTYNMQGPGESVIDGTTGWLADSDSELVDLASQIWKNGYNQKMRKDCIQSASIFDVKKISENWLKLFSQL